MATLSSALTALEPFIILSKSATSPRAAADLIQRATSHPQTYVFTELLSTPNIQALRSGPLEYQSSLTLLEIFSWGTYADYQNTKNLPPLNSQQELKLRCLTLLSLPPTPKSYTYGALLKSLSLPSVAALESTLIHAIYAGIIVGKLSPQTQALQVSSLAPLRDLPPASVGGLIKALDAWSVRCVEVLTVLENEVKTVHKNAAERERRDGILKAAQAKAMAELEKGDNKKEKGAGKRASGDGDEATGEEMDIDQHEGGAGGKRRSKRVVGLFGTQK